MKYAALVTALITAMTLTFSATASANRHRVSPAACFRAHGWTVLTADPRVVSGGTAHPTSPESLDFWETYVLWLHLPSRKPSGRWLFDRRGELTLTELRVVRACLHRH